MTKTNFAHLDALKVRLNDLRPLSDAIVDEVHENLVLQWTYHSNAIEGNSLTLEETKEVLNGFSVGGKTLNELFEVINHREAIRMVEELVQQQLPLSEWAIKNLHQAMLKNIDAGNARSYRRTNFLGEERIPMDFGQVSQAMQNFVDWYKSEASSLHPVERAARVYGELVKIHPFLQGNSSIACLLMNLELLKAGFPAALIQIEQKLAYCQALDTAHCSGDYQAVIDLVAQAVERGFEPYWLALGVK